MYGSIQSAGQMGCNMLAHSEVCIPLEKLTAVQGDETIFTFYGAQWPITMLATLDPILSQMNSVHALTHCFFK
jgi:hypothetical protein